MSSTGGACSGAAGCPTRGSPAANDSTGDGRRGRRSGWIASDQHEVEHGLREGRRWRRRPVRSSRPCKETARRGACAPGRPASRCSGVDLVRPRRAFVPTLFRAARGSLAPSTARRPRGPSATRLLPSDSCLLALPVACVDAGLRRNPLLCRAILVLPLDVEAFCSPIKQSVSRLRRKLRASTFRLEKVFTSHDVGHLALSDWRIECYASFCVASRMDTSAEALYASRVCFFWFLSVSSGFTRPPGTRQPTQAG
jgi:hypothetical protein